MTTIQQCFWCGRTDGRQCGCGEVHACGVETQPVFGLITSCKVKRHACGGSEKANNA